MEIAVFANETKREPGLVAILGKGMAELPGDLRGRWVVANWRLETLEGPGAAGPTCWVCEGGVGLGLARVGCWVDSVVCVRECVGR